MEFARYALDSGSERAGLSIGTIEINPHRSTLRWGYVCVRSRVHIFTPLITCRFAYTYLYAPPPLWPSLSPNALTIIASDDLEQGRQAIIFTLLRDYPGFCRLPTRLAQSVFVWAINNNFRFSIQASAYSTRPTNAFPTYILRLDIMRAHAPVCQISKINFVLCHTWHVCSFVHVCRLVVVSIMDANSFEYDWPLMCANVRENKTVMWLVLIKIYTVRGLLSIRNQLPLG